MKETDLALPNFEMCDSEEMRIILMDYQQKISKLAKERDARILPSLYFSTIATLGLLAVIFISINRSQAYDEGYLDGKQRISNQLEKLQQTYCLEKHQKSAAYQACLDNLLGGG